MASAKPKLTEKAKPKLTEKLKTEAYKTKTETCKTKNRGLLKLKTKEWRVLMI
jgi:hypothetical protein